MRPHLVLLMGLACVSTAQADPVADLRAKLQTLRADTPLKGVLEADYQEFDAKGVADKAKAAHLQLAFDSKDGLDIHLSPELVRSLSAEEARNVADPDSPTPQADLLQQMRFTHIQHVLSAADGLSRLMDGASLSGSKAATLDGAAVTELDLAVPMKLPAKAKEAASDYHGDLSVWVDSQGVPLRFQERLHSKFCKFWFCITVDEGYTGVLKLVDGRLVNAEYGYEIQQTGQGQDFHSKTVSTLQLQ